MNAKMPELKKCFEAAGFKDAKTVLSSGNVVFSARASSDASLERKAETAMKSQLGRSFLTIVRSLDALRSILASDPYEAFRLSPGAKRVVTFLRKRPEVKLTLPIELDGARILCLEGSEAFSAYVPGPRGPVFMTLIEKTFGEAVTTRTWDTVKKVTR
jgi:uncharacterized protein (DUF1697 family)